MKANELVVGTIFVDSMGDVMYILPKRDYKGDKLACVLNTNDKCAKPVYKSSQVIVEKVLGNLEELFNSLAGK